MKTETGGEPIVGRSPAMERIRKLIEKVALTDDNVLILGEAGTGRTFLARKIHELSPRHTKPLVVVNCTALGNTLTEADLFGEKREGEESIQRKSGLVEEANGGTLLLETIEDLTPEYQQRFLVVFQENKLRRKGEEAPVEVDFRTIATAEKNLEEKVSQGEFRRDLFALLSGARIEIPPLRERLQDIPYLFEYFLTRSCEESNRPLPVVPSDLFEAFMDYDWKGNLREFRQCVRNLALMSPPGQLSLDYLPFQLKKHPLEYFLGKTLGEATADVEIYLIKKALAQFRGNQTQAATALGVSEATLRYKMKKHGLRD